MIGSSSRQAARHTRPASPRPEGRAQPLRSGRQGTALGSAAGPRAHSALERRLGQRPGFGRPNPFRPRGLLAHAQNAGFCRAGVSGVSVGFPCAYRRWGGR